VVLKDRFIKLLGEFLQGRDELEANCLFFIKERRVEHQLEGIRINTIG